MLADSAADVGDALETLGEASFEYKLDGARIQVHKIDDEVRVYSRALRDVTIAVPEVVTVVRAMPARTLVLDGEAIALRPDGTPLPFQDTMRRFGRKLDVDRADGYAADHADVLRCVVSRRPSAGRRAADPPRVAARGAGRRGESGPAPGDGESRTRPRPSAGARWPPATKA